jgi:glycosyltransferase involved in cell wall biosynthesis
MKKLLFIGSFLSKKTGTRDVAEKLSLLLKSEGYNVLLASDFQNRYLRLFHIIFSILFVRTKKIFIDVFSGQAFYLTMISVAIASKLNKKIYLTLRGGGLVDFHKKKSKAVEKVFKKSNYIQTPSLFLKDYFSNFGFDIKYLPNAVNFNHFSYNRDNVVNYSILWVRAFSEEYNPFLAINILFEIKKKYPEAKLTMIGPDKGILNDIKEMIRNLKIEDSVNILGPIKNEELYQYYQTHNVYINTTSYESFGTSLIEAAACGIPIISTCVGEVPLIWKNNHNILIVNSFDPKEFSERIDEVLKDNFFSDFISKNALKNIQKFSWKKIRTKWLKTIEINEFKI